MIFTKINNYQSLNKNCIFQVSRRFCQSRLSNKEIANTTKSEAPKSKCNIDNNFYFS